MNKKGASKIRIAVITACVCLALGCGGFELLLLMLGVTVHFEVLWTLLFGWIAFLGRTLPRVAWNGSMVGMGVVCAAGTIMITQWLLRETTRNLRIAPWQWRWTLCGIASIGVLFLVGLSIGGAVHQIGWMLGSEEPLAEERSSHPLYELSDTVHRQFDAPGLNDTLGWREALMNRRWNRREDQVIQETHILFILNDEKLVTGVLLVPREARLRKPYKGIYLTEKDEHWLDRERMEALIRENLAHLEAF